MASAQQQFLQISRIPQACQLALKRPSQKNTTQDAPTKKRLGQISHVGKKTVFYQKKRHVLWDKPDYLILLLKLHSNYWSHTTVFQTNSGVCLVKSS
jgi:hypothetical protein